MNTYTLADARATHPAFFSPSTMHAFNSRILGKMYNGPGGSYFVTSERDTIYEPDSPREYKVR